MENLNSNAVPNLQTDKGGSKKINWWMVTSGVLAVVLIGMSLYAYSLITVATKTPLNRSEKVISDQPTITPVVSAVSDRCEAIQGLGDFQYCEKRAEIVSNYILSNFGKKYEYVEQYSVSPNKKWLFIVSDAESQIKQPSAPGTYAITMVDVINDVSYPLFSDISGVSDLGDGWSPDGRGVVFLASEGSVPGIIKKANDFGVVYCSTKCKLLASDGGGEINGNTAFFEDGKIHYVDVNGIEKIINFVPDKE